MQKAIEVASVLRTPVPVQCPLMGLEVKSSASSKCGYAASKFPRSPYLDIYLSESIENCSFVVSFYSRTSNRMVQDWQLGWQSISSIDFFLCKGYMS